MKIDHFTDDMIVEVIEGRRVLSEAERRFLIADTPSFEECDKDVARDLPGMSDKDLIRAAYNVWADYASGQIS
jgi:hypothetical protein